MKKWILLIGAALILCFVLFIYVSFSGNPISKKMAEKRLDEYIGDTFEGSVVSMDATGYNFKDASYYFLYTVQQGELVAQYSSEVRGAWFPKEVWFTSLIDQYRDQELMSKYHTVGSLYVKEALEEKNVPVEEVLYDVLIVKGRYEADEPWTPNMPKDAMPTIWVDIIDQNQTKEQFTETVKTIQQTLEEHDVTYTNVRVEMTRTFDNTDGSKKGYAEYYYETIYSTNFASADEKFTVIE